MSWRGRGAALLAALGMAACASVPQMDLPPGGESLSGRLAVTVDATQDTTARSENAGFELQGTAENGRMTLSTPIGTLLAEARWSPGSVTLVTPQGARHFADLTSLTREILGESIPVEALFDWLRGRPWAGAPSATTVEPPGGGFSQLGWTVDLARLDAGVIVAHRSAPPVVTVRAKIDR